MKRNTKIKKKKSRTIEHAAPLADTATADALRIHPNSHGRGNLKIKKNIWNNITELQK